jgi:MFS family permease
VLTALVIADITGITGRFNLAQGIVGTASGIGASISTTLSGLVAERVGSSAGFLYIAATALLATMVVLFLMPETKPQTNPSDAQHRRASHEVNGSNTINGVSSWLAPDIHSPRSDNPDH